MFVWQTISEYGMVIEPVSGLRCTAWQKSLLASWTREVTQVQRVLRSAAELRNGAVELDVEVVDGHDQVISESIGVNTTPSGARVRALFLQIRIATGDEPA